jgi:uncharacterized protein YjbI with pentapeptide repeats
MVQEFDLDEIETLASDLGVDWGEIVGDKKSTKSRSLITHVARLGLLEDLVALAREERPRVQWPELPPPQQQIEDAESVSPAGGINVAGRDIIGGDSTIKADHSQVSQTGDAIGSGSKVAKDVSGPVIQADQVTLGKSQRDEQYEIALHWDGKTRLRGFDLAERDLTELDLSGADLRGANLSGADLSRSILRRARLDGAIMTGATLNQAKLGIPNPSDLTVQLIRNPQEHWAVLRNVDLRNASLLMADLSYADLTGAQLRKGLLFGTNLSNATLAGADLSGAYLTGADLGWTNMKDIVYDDKTVWPEGFDPSEAFTGSIF